MKLRQYVSPFSLTILQLTSSVYSHATHDLSVDVVDGKAARDSDSEYKQAFKSTFAATLQAKATPAVVVGTQDAPVDGKDGRPHEGPFVETAAERDRKKAKESGKEEAPMTSKKPAPKATPKGALHTEGWDSALPESNDGVMDDPNRTGPKEGTRGTEGGISEKNRERKAQTGQDGIKSEKTPEKPKEAPPLPHSEQEKLVPKEGKESYDSDKAPTKESAEKFGGSEKEIGGLEVFEIHPVIVLLCALGNLFYRNRTTYLRSPMTSRTQYLPAYRKKIISRYPNLPRRSSTLPSLSQPL